MQHGRLAGPVSAMSEIHMHYEHPFRFVYHTLRWLSVRPAATLHAAVNCDGLPIDRRASFGASINNTPASAEGSAVYKPVRVVSVAKAFLLWFRTRRTKKEDADFEKLLKAAQRRTARSGKQRGGSTEKTSDVRAASKTLVVMSLCAGALLPWRVQQGAEDN